LDFPAFLLNIKIDFNAINQVLLGLDSADSAGATGMAGAAGAVDPGDSFSLSQSKYPWIRVRACLPSPGAFCFRASWIFLTSSSERGLVGGGRLDSFRLDALMIDMFRRLMYEEVWGRFHVEVAFNIRKGAFI
jgi:hypothetical protein